MADVELPDPRKSGDRLNVGIVQRVPGVESHAGLDDGLSRPSDLGEPRRDLRHVGGAAMLVKRVCIGAGMDLTDREAAFRGRSDLTEVRIDEGRHRDSDGGQSLDDIGHPFTGSRDVEPSLGGDLVSPFRHQHDDLRSNLGGDRDHLVRGGHLEIQLDLNEFLQSMDIGILDVPAVFPQMDGDSSRTTQMRLHGGPDRIRFPGRTGLPDRRDVVDVDAKFDHAGMLSGMLPPEAYTPKERGPFVNDQTEDFQTQLQILRDQITKQGVRVLEQATQAVDCYFDHDLDKAREVLQIELVVDEVDVEIEKQCIPVLALGQTNSHSIRSVLTIVKVNNEFERIGDCAVTIAEATLDPQRTTSNLPQTFRVMANSVLGMIRDANRALSKNDPVLARRVLDFDDTVDRFKQEILLDAQQRLADGALAVDGAFRLLAVTKSLERIADHCTNVCEQVIYLETGKIVRHDAEGWTQPQDPNSSEH